MNNIQRVIEERNKVFDENVNKVRNEIRWGKATDSPQHEFGFKMQRVFTTVSGNEVPELFTVVDWGNIESHISETIRQVLQAVEEEVEVMKKNVTLDIKKIPDTDNQGLIINADTLPAIMHNAREYMRDLRYERGYNSALSDIQSLLKSAKENIK
jgi:hypothetical protein